MGIKTLKIPPAIIRMGRERRKSIKGSHMTHQVQMIKKKGNEVLTALILHLIKGVSQLIFCCSRKNLRKWAKKGKNIRK
jgi:hypothetical protein